MHVLYIATDPELMPGFYVDLPEHGLTGPFADEDHAQDCIDAIGASDYVRWMAEPPRATPPDESVWGEP